MTVDAFGKIIVLDKAASRKFHDAMHTSPKPLDVKTNTIKNRVNSGRIHNETQLIHAEVEVLDGEIISLCQIELIDEVFNISVSTLSEYQGKGYAKSVVGKCVRWWRAHYFSQPLSWWTKAHNTASLKLAEGHGFKFAEADGIWKRYVLEGQ